MTTRQTPDARREARRIAADVLGLPPGLRSEYMDGKFDTGDHVRIALAALNSRAGDDLTSRERIARVVAWEHFGIAWHHMEKQSHADVLAMVDRMLGSRAGDAGEGALVEAARSILAAFSGPDPYGKMHASVYEADTVRLDRALEAATPAPAVDAQCSASHNHADILETIQNAADDWQKQGYPTALAEVRDMANVGRALMTAIADNAGSPPLKGWHPADCPSEIVGDLLKMLDDAVPAVDAVPAGEVERLARIRTSMALLQQNSEGCALNHYGDDAQIHGMPGWLIDTKADLDAFTDILARWEATRG